MDVTHLVFSLKGISFDRLVAVVADTLKDVGTKSAKIGNQLEKVRNEANQRDVLLENSL